MCHSPTTCPGCGVQFTWLGVWIKGKAVRRGKPQEFCTSNCQNALQQRKWRKANPYSEQPEEWKDRRRSTQLRCRKNSPQLRAACDARTADRERWKGAAFAAMGAEDKAKTIAIYSERDRLNAIHGAGAYHVDHLQPYAEGGEHIWWNLQILTAAENLSKNSEFRAEDQALYTQRIVELFNNEG